MAYAIGDLVTMCRNMVNDTIEEGSTPSFRYSNQEFMDAFNDAFIQARAKRPDAFLAIGLRAALPYYTVTDVTNNTAFPLDPMFFPAFMFYMCGRIELKEDTFSDDNRAVTLMNKFTSQLLALQS
jgi:hypothetical protein